MLLWWCVLNITKSDSFIRHLQKNAYGFFCGIQAQMVIKISSMRFAFKLENRQIRIVYPIYSALIGQFLNDSTKIAFKSCFFNVRPEHKLSLLS